MSWVDAATNVAVPEGWTSALDTEWVDVNELLDETSKAVPSSEPPQCTRRALIVAGSVASTASFHVTSHS